MDRRHSDPGTSVYHHEPGSLARKHWRYLHERTAGGIAALHDLIRLAAVRAVHRGVESVNRGLLDSITMSYASEVQYAKSPTPSTSSDDAHQDEPGHRAGRHCLTCGTCPAQP